MSTTVRSTLGHNDGIPGYDSLAYDLGVIKMIKSPGLAHVLLTLASLTFQRSQQDAPLKEAG